MTQRLQADPVEALDARQALGAWLGQLRGMPLDPAHVEERLHGLGALAAWCEAGGASARPPARSPLETGAGEGGATVPEMTVLDHLPDEVQRSLAALFREWGMGRAARGETDLAERYLDIGLGSLLGHPAAPGGLRAFLLDEQRDCALGALDRDEAELAWLHWRVLARHEAPGGPRREVLVRRAIRRESGVAAAGMERGVVGGELAALRRLGAVAVIEPGSDDLHLAILKLASHAGLRYHTLGNREAFGQVMAAAAASLAWTHDRAPGAFGTVEREHIAEASVCAAAATELPWEAVAHLRRATRYRPGHPTARGLLAVSLAALAARRLGHGRHDEARAAAVEAGALFQTLDLEPPDLAGWERLCEQIGDDDESV